jgi:hypothetical protein
VRIVSLAVMVSALSAPVAAPKVVQTPGLILILNADLTYRQIFLDGRALETDPNPSWMGYSVGPLCQGRAGARVRQGRPGCADASH